MAYSKDDIRKARQVIAKRRDRAEREAEAKYEQFKKAIPRVVEIDRELMTVGCNIGRYVIDYPDTIEEKMRELKEKSLTLQKEQEALFVAAGITKDSFAPDYTCKNCGDTGYREGQMCSCLQELLRLEAAKALNSLSPLSLCDFENFSLDYYPTALTGKKNISPRAVMADHLAYCRQYTADFSPFSESILMLGNTGLGKTHLSLSIASEVIKKDYSVIYGSAQNLLTQLEKEHFGRSSQDKDSLQALLNCDLLILDDLGTEFSTSFTTAAIYNIINSRQLTRKATIVSTNLSIAELEEKYSDRIVSRMTGAYRILPFAGNDIRLLKLRSK